MYTAQHICSIDNAAGDGWVDVLVVVDGLLAVTEVTLTGSTENVRDQLTVAQLAQIRAAIDRVESQLLAQLRRASDDDRAADYWSGRAA